MLCEIFSLRKIQNAAGVSLVASSFKISLSEKSPSTVTVIFSISDLIFEGASSCATTCSLSTAEKKNAATVYCMMKIYISLLGITECVFNKKPSTKNAGSIKKITAAR